MRIVAIITSRWQSTRLPGKALMDICGKPMLRHVVDNARDSMWIDDVVVATTETSQLIVDYCRNNNILYASCSSEFEECILSRVFGAAEAYRADYVVRLWGDAPLVTTAQIDRAIEMFLESPIGNYVTLSTKHGVVAVTSRDILDVFNADITDPDDRKWIHKYLRDRKDLSVNDENDLRLVREIVRSKESQLIGVG